MSTIITSSIAEVRRQDLLTGTPCRACSLHTAVGPDNHHRLSPGRPYPRRLVIEPSIRCNIRCNNAVCNIANDAAFHLRREDFLSWEVYTALIDEVGPHLDDVHFYNYGEPFIHPRALDMLAYAKAANPRIWISTSTNGVLLARDGMADRLVREQLLDRITFTIGGVDDASYSAYHKSSSFDKAIRGLRNVVEAKRLHGREAPHVYWRYLVFNWNDSDAHIAEALRMKDEIGVDSFEFFLTRSPLDGISLRRAPGTRGYAAIEPWVSAQDGYEVDPYSEAGLFGLEHDPLLGDFCWTGRTASLQVPVDDGQIVLRMHRPDLNKVSRPTVTIHTPWGEEPGAVGPYGWEDNRIAVPSSYRGAFAQVDLTVSPIFSPVRHGGNLEDNRELGIQVCMEGIGPQPNPYRIRPYSSAAS